MTGINVAEVAIIGTDCTVEVLNGWHHVRQAGKPVGKRWDMGGAIALAREVSAESTTRRIDRLRTTIEELVTYRDALDSDLRRNASRDGTTWYTDRAREIASTTTSIRLKRDFLDTLLAQA